MVELNEKALEAACRAWINADSPLESGIRDAIRAYFSTIPAPDDGLVEKLRGFEQAYSTEFFAPLSEMEKANVGGELRSRIAADMGRHLAKHFSEAATALQSKDEQIERLTRERDEALADPYKVMGGIYEKWKSRAEALEQQVQKLTAENERLREALRPFAEFALYVHMLVEGRAANGGSPILPTKHLRKSDFDRARTALETQEGGE
ncbi:hypothetical protein [Parvibaculum sp.]|uniref:hypothetical protein n=1 Tax=Parvibaculum sp. TaxID=2024848 RepID=UPI003C71E709